MSIIIENKELCLTLGEDCIAKSLVCKATGEECLMQGENLPLFSLTEDRPYNNEIKLAHPNKKTTFQANRVRREGNNLIVGFELVTFEAIVEVKEADKYVSFTLVDFIIKPEDFGGLAMTPPPVAEFRLIQLPIKNREKFGEWLNVSWDDKAAINVLANTRWPIIDSEKRNGYRVMFADARRDVKLKGNSASLIVTPGADLMDAIEQLEIDYDLPRGVESRKGDKINASAYWAANVNPTTVDEHIAYAKQAGFRMMLIYYCSMVTKSGGYDYCGDYDFNAHFPNGEEDLKAMLKKIKDAGITPGIHFLQTHIGINSSYVTPVADHRLNLTRHFTLAKELGTDDTTIYVEQNPEGTTMHPKTRVLQFNGELIHYESYTTEWPYMFTGCVRGHWNTNVTPHQLGTIGGILDVSEFCAISVYIDQNTSLQDEVAWKLAKIYDCGFEFIYYDGSEGTNPPFEIHVPNAQYKVLEKIQSKKPLYCEGAAKAHFSWHFLAGGNAFDVFPMPIFKKMIARFPLEEAPRMAEDFTRVNFGWWCYKDDTMPDIYEYGTSKAASWDCPITLQVNTNLFKTNPRTPDTFEVMRRWEDIRAKNWLTEEQKVMLRDPDREFILLVNENGDYELVEYTRIKLPEAIDADVTAYVFERANKAYVVTWSTKGEANLKLDLAGDLEYEVQLGGETIPFENGILPLAGRRYLSGASKDALVKAFENATMA
ncbi:MAG: hypothetical protein E7613_08480 [Ruminococcaceae bacterium]|nr:hypothetical protein [Oscillospiraceae bacterium]